MIERIASWARMRRRLARALAAASRSLALVAIFAIGLLVAAPVVRDLGLPVWGALLPSGLLVLMALRGGRFQASPAGRRSFAAEVDERCLSGDRLQTALELESSSPPSRPFVTALLSDVRRRLTELRRPLLGRARICALWMLWLGLWLAGPGLERPLPPSSERPRGEPAGFGSASSRPRDASAGRVAIRADAEAMPERPPTGAESEPLPPEPIVLDDAARVPRYIEPLRQEGEQHEKEVATVDREVAPQPEAEDRPAGERMPEEIDQPLGQSDERVRRTLLPPERQALVRRYFERLRR